MKMLRGRSTLIEIYRFLALTTAFCTPEKFVTALGALIALFFRFHPCFRLQITPCRNRPQDDPLTHGDREFIDMPAGKIRTFMATLIPLFPSTSLDFADLTHNERLIGQAAMATDIRRRQSVYRGQTFLEVVVVILMGNPDAADTAV
jgi:hypothetical protein